MDKKIELCRSSKELLDYVKKTYKEVDKYIPAKEAIIHMYPEEDTWDEEDGWWKGYMDALFMTVKVYNTEDKTVFVAKWRDVIDLSKFEGYSSTIKMFKDKSTMITLKSKKPIWLRNGQSMDFI